jgi:hypothetical protein
MWDDTSCVALCPPNTITVEGTDKWCAPECPLGEFADLSVRLSTCESCSDKIEDCEECYYDTSDNDVICSTCVLGEFPTWRGTKCSHCFADQFEDAQDCRFCSDYMDNCYQCTSDGQGTVECDACFGSIPSTLNSDGKIESCECDAVQIIKISDVLDPTSVMCESCLHTIPNCNTCEEVISWDGAILSYEDLTCTQCRNGYWIDEDGECSTNSCRTLNENNECIECNEKGDGIIWKTQEDYCVS